MKRHIGATLLLATLVGCGSAPQPSLIDPGPPELAQGWKTYDKMDHGFAMAAPESWSPLRRVKNPGMGMSDTGSAGGEMDRFLENMNDSMEADSAAEAEAQAGKDAEKNIYLRLYDNTVKPAIGEIQTGMFVEVRPGAPPLDQAVKDYLANYLKEEWRKGNKRVQLPIGPAEEIRTQVVDQKGDVLDRIAYVFVHKTSQFIVTFQQTNNAGDINTVSRSMMDTFRVKL